MGRINLQGLIDEVLNMVKERNAGNGGQGNRPSWYGGNKDEEEYWKEIRKRNTATEVQGSINQGALAVEGEKNVGALARQRLTNEGNTNVADINAGAHKYGADKVKEGQIYNADMGLKGHEATAGATKYSADRTFEANTNKNSANAARFKALADIHNSMDTPPEDKAEIRKQIMLMGNGDKAITQDNGTATTRDARSFFNTTTTLPPATDTAVPLPVKLSGAQSMEFRSGPKPMTKEEEENKYLGMLPGVKKKERKNIFGW